MMMVSNEYWQGRFLELEEALLKLGIDAYDDIEKAYRKALASIDRDITSWYTRLAANNNISYADAKKLLTSNQLEEFRWTVEEYIERSSHNVDGRWTKQLENASAKVHISRLDAIKLQLQQHLEVLYSNQLDRLDAAIRQIYTEGYYRTAYELQKGGIGTNLHLLDEQRIKQVLSKPWATDGKDFSARIWESRDKLVNTLHAELTQAVIRGDGLKKVTDTIAKKMNTSKAVAGRLVMTESAFFTSKSQLDGYKAMDVEQYEIVATLDRRTSEVCRGMDGKVFKLSEFNPGITAPPFHCWCRSCTAPYFSDAGGVRAARDENGEYRKVPADMKYDEWYEKYIDKRGADNGIINKKLKNNGVIEVHKVAVLDKKLYSVVTDNIVTDEVIITDRQIEHIKERHPNDYDRFAKYFSAIIAEPDYIIEANKPNTALILKEIENEGEVFKTVLRLVTSSDPKGYKNSIITFMKIDESEWNRLVRNKKILYQRE